MAGHVRRHFVSSSHGIPTGFTEVTGGSIPFLAMVYGREIHSNIACWWVFWWVVDGVLMVFWWLLMVFWWCFDGCLMVVWWFFDGFYDVYGTAILHGLRGKNNILFKISWRLFLLQGWNWVWCFWIWDHGCWERHNATPAVVFSLQMLHLYSAESEKIRQLTESFFSSRCILWYPMLAICFPICWFRLR